MEYVTTTVLSGVIMSVVLSRPFAESCPYLDPGVGSYLIQLLVAGLVGLLFVLKTRWRRIKMFIRRVLRGKRAHGQDQR